MISSLTDSLAYHKPTHSRGDLVAACEEEMGIDYVNLR